MNSTVPFEGDANVDSVIRRLKNVKREHRKAEKINAEAQSKETTDTIDPSTLGPESASSNLRKEYEIPGPMNPGGLASQQASGYTTPDHEDLVDENGNIRPDATIVGGNGERRNLNDIIARIQDPNTKWDFPSRNDKGVRTLASFAREEEEEMRRKGISISPRPDSPAHSSQSSTSTGYIPPPEERTPGGTRQWNYRDFLAYIHLIFACMETLCNHTHYALIAVGFPCHQTKTKTGKMAAKQNFNYPHTTDRVSTVIRATIETKTPALQ